MNPTPAKQGNLPNRELRENLTLLRQAVRRRWDVPADAMQKLLLDTLAMAAASDSQRDKLRAVELVRAMHSDDIKALELLDKIERLDSGVATERVEFKPLSFGGEG